MKKRSRMRGFLNWTLGILVLLNGAIIATGNSYLYKAVFYNFADIDDNSIFLQRPVPAGVPQEWPRGTDYNKTPMPSALNAELEQIESVAFLIVKDDSLRFEKYWDGYSDHSLSNSFSMAKTFVGILTGIAMKEGKIASLDDPVGKYLPEFSEGKKAKVTIRHLLTMSSGLNWDESYANPFSVTTKAYYGDNLRELIFSLEAVEEPGKTFKYLSGNTQLLAFVVEKATGRKISDYASEKLWKPLGAVHSAEWSIDKKEGDEKAYCCFYSNARDFARIGQLYLKNGNWKGSQVVPEDFVKASVIPSPLLEEDGTANNCYGYSWWLIPEYKGMKGIYYARGILGQYIIVVPEKNMVIVRLGKKRGQKQDSHWSETFSMIDGAINMFP